MKPRPIACVHCDKPRPEEPRDYYFWRHVRQENGDIAWFCDECAGHPLWQVLDRYHMHEKEKAAS